MFNRYVTFTFFAIIGSGSFYLISKFNNNKASNFYGLVFNESIAGLMVGSSVVIKGVKVGIVTDIKLLPEELDKALVVIKTLPLKELDRIQAKLALANFMGHSIIDLYYVKLSYAMPNIKGYPQIRVAESMMKKIQNTIEDLINENNLAQINESGKNALEIFNKGVNNLSVGIEKGTAFLSNAVKFSEELIKFTEELRLTKGKLNEALDILNQILGDKNVKNFVREGLPNTTAITSRLNEDLRAFEESPIKFLIRGKQEKKYKVQVKPPQKKE